MKIEMTAAMVFCLAICPGNVIAQSSSEDKPQDGLTQLAAAETPLRNGDRIAFFGDSVTMQGGYIQLMQKAFNQSTTVKQLDVKLIKHGLCDIHKSFLKKLKEVNPENRHQGHLTYDGVHMNDQGNALLADQISRAIIKACQSR